MGREARQAEIRPPSIMGIAQDRGFLEGFDCTWGGEWDRATSHRERKGERWGMIQAGLGLVRSSQD